MMCVVLMFVFFFKQKTAYEMRISDWSSDVCSSDLKRASLIQRRCSTSSRCNREICPAGPPKPIKPSLSHRRNACQKVTVAGASTGSSMGNVIAVLVISWSFDLRFVFKSSKQAVKDTTGCDDKLIVVGKGVALPRQDALDAARLRRLHTTHIQVMHQGADTPQTRLIQD